MKKKQKINYKEITNPLFYYVIVVFNGTPYKEAQDFAEEKLQVKFNDMEPVEACVFTASDCSNHVVWFNKKKPRLDTIIHESFHSTHHSLERKRVKLSMESDEVYAYLLEWTVTEIMKVL